MLITSSTCGQKVIEFYIIVLYYNYITLRHLGLSNLKIGLESIKIQKGALE